MPIDVEHGWSAGLASLGLHRLPQLPGPLGHHLRQAFGCSRMGQAGEKPFGVALTVGPRPPCQHGQHHPGIAPQIPGTGQASHGQKQQREN
jgi:hypothetical protein